MSAATENTHLLHADNSSGDILEGREVEVYRPGKSTFTQTLLNMIGEIIGTGLLACPMAIAQAGWAFGPLILLFLGLLTILELLMRIIEKDRRLRNFTDIIGYALGESGRRWAVVLYTLEVLGWMAMMVILFGESMTAVFQKYTSDQWKLIGMAVVVPAGFVPLRYLAFTSFMGVAATWSTVGLLAYVGVTRHAGPGSLWDAASTDLWPSQGWVKLGTTFGVFISGLGGQSLSPILIHDMKEPEHAKRMIETSYALAMMVYLSIASLGYIMYGREVSDEISRDIALTPGHSPFTSKFAVLMVAITIISKVPLSLRPFADIIFTSLHLHPSVLAFDSKGTDGTCATHGHSAPGSSSPSDCSPGKVNDSPSPQAILQAAHDRREATKAQLRPILRVVISILSLMTGILFPSFGSLLSFLGAGLGMAMQVTMPLLAAIAMWGVQGHWLVLSIASGIVGVVGTISVCVG